MGLDSFGVMENFSFDDVDTARGSLAGRVIRTPILPLRSSKIAPYLPDDASLFMKLHEQGCIVWQVGGNLATA